MINYKILNNTLRKSLIENSKFIKKNGNCKGIKCRECPARYFLGSCCKIALVALARTVIASNTKK
ncbi:MAG TPA: hypothetical protein PLR64_00510 [Candidatus Dojkabacteria bacterium]|nr:hypothetical protein [Candidatus Dojkabacteria bacterium]